MKEFLRNSRIPRGQSGATLVESGLLILMVAVVSSSIALQFPKFELREEAFDPTEIALNNCGGGTCTSNPDGTFAIPQSNPDPDQLGLNCSGGTCTSNPDGRPKGAKEEVPSDDEVGTFLIGK